MTHRMPLARMFACLALFTIASALPGSVPRAAASTDPREVAVSTPDPGPVTDTVAGVYAAIGCGLFGRALMGGMVLPGVIAGAIASCGFMLFDALVLDQ